MSRRFVTLLTEERGLRFEERRLRRSMRIVAMGTVLGDRLMLPQEGAAEFGVTARAGLMYGVFHQTGGGSRAMRCMA